MNQEQGLLLLGIYNPYYFYLWGHLQSTVCATEVSDVQNFQQWTQNGFEMIRAKPGIFQRIRQSQRPALKLKVDISSNFFNLQEAITRRPRFRRPRLIKHFLLFCGLHFPLAVLSVQFVYTFYKVVFFFFVSV